jgi:7-keto-8-aminopelargonate synthetase-like enzyme
MQYIQSPSAATIRVDERDILSFGGCSYLGVGALPEVIEAGRTALGNFGATAQLPRHYGFQSPANQAAEEAAKVFFGSEGAMYIGTGYLFALIALSGLKNDYDVAILDETAHFCLTDGALAAGKQIVHFRHCDADDLQRVVSDVVDCGKRFVVATDGAFPTVGRVPPLALYAEITERHNAWLIVDESHSFGSVGFTGRGACEHEGIIGRPKVLAGGSASKAFGAFGGLVIGSSEAIGRLWQAPASKGTALGMTSGAAMLTASLNYLRANPERFDSLRRNSATMQCELKKIGIICADTPAPIFSFTHGRAADMARVQQALYDDDIFITYSNYVGAGAEGVLRIAVFADHQPEHFTRLINSLSRNLTPS